MKKIITLLFCISFIVGVKAQISKTVDVATAGTLSSLVTSTEQTTITDFVVTGTINADDLTFIQGMTALKTIDMSGTSGITDLGETFSNNEKLASIVIPNSVTTIGYRAFYGCSLLTSIIIPPLVTAIGREAFANCSLLTSITIPPLVNIIDYSAFYDCVKMQTINVDSQNKAYSSIDGVLFNKDQTNLITYPQSKSGAYIVPSSVSVIKEQAFLRCRLLSSVIIPSSVSSIEFGVFEGCSSLISISIPNSIDSIMDATFKKCSSLVSISIPASVTSIVNTAFLDCVQLNAINVDSKNTTYSSIDGVLFSKDQKTIFVCPEDLQGIYTIPSSVTNIGEAAFYNCISLSPIIIPSSVTNIGAYAFVGCKLLTSITLPSSINSIGQKIFLNCPQLTSITLSSSITLGSNLLPSTLMYIYTIGTPKDQDPATFTNISDCILYVGKGLKSTYQSKTGWSAFKIIIEKDFLTKQSDICASLTIMPHIKQVQCPSGRDGAIAIDVTGGVEPYVFKWTNTRSDKQLVNIPAGVYSVEITDANLCTTVQSFEVSQPAALSIDTSSTAPACAQANGAITVNVLGGTAPYTYLWSDQSSNASVTGKAAGVYSLTVTDVRGCKQSAALSLANADAPQVTLTSASEAHCSVADGAINISVSGANAPFAYSWSDAAGITTEDRMALAPGNYAVKVSDSKGCEASLAVNVPAKALVRPQIEVVTVSNKTKNNVVAWLRPTSTNVKYYTVYKELTTAGSFNEVSNVPSTEYSVYEDAASVATEASNRYRLSSTDSCGNKSELSAVAEYKTMHLATKAESDAIVLTWDSYEGLQWLQYLVYRDGKVIDTLPSYINHYSDKAASLGSHSYFVAINLPNEIDPKVTKTDTGPFSQSFSNMSEASLVAVSETLSANVKIYPNPAKELITIELLDADGEQVRLIAANGAVLATTSIIDGKAQFAVGGLAKGIYTVQLQTNEKAVSEQVVVE